MFDEWKEMDKVRVYRRVKIWHCYWLDGRLIAVEYNIITKLGTLNSASVCLTKVTA